MQISAMENKVRTCHFFSRFAVLWSEGDVGLQAEPFPVRRAPVQEGI